MPSLSPSCRLDQKNHHLLSSDCEGACELEEDNSMPLCRLLMMTTCAHYMKMFALMSIAGIHLFYLVDFLETFKAYEELTERALDKVPSTGRGSSMTSITEFVMRVLVDYKKNLWMTVGSMSASLATTAVFVVFIPFGAHLNRKMETLLRVVDVCAFLTLPFILYARIIIAKNLEKYLPDAVRAAASLADPQKLMNTLHCSILPRENLPLCSFVIDRSIIPIKVLEYLLILCVLTGAYILLAYLIAWIIHHWFPPSNSKSKCMKQPFVLSAA